VLLFLLVVGGLYMGIFSPTAAGAVGAFGALVYALFRRMKVKQMIESFYETVVLNSQFFPVIIGGYIFSRFIALTGLVDAFMTAVTVAQIPAFATMCIFILVLLFLGCILDPISMLVITMPIFFPILTGLGYDPIALAIIVVILINIAGITPPIGLGCFVVASVARVDPAEVFRGVLPFFITSLVVMFLIIFFPSIATWLPSLMF
jgi:TRAP-type C4-dicarboxylate transport system permease large subunit